MKKVVYAVVFIVALVVMLCAGILVGRVVSPMIGGSNGLFGPMMGRQGTNPGFQPGLRNGFPGQRQSITGSGALVLEVVSGSPADQAGIKTGEWILALNGTTINQQSDLAKILANFKPGDTINITVQQAGQNQQDLSVKLGDNPNSKGTAWLGIRYRTVPAGFPQGQMPGLPGNGNGNVQPQTPRNMPFSGQVAHPGALVRNVTSGSPADQAGIKSGQLIAAVDGAELKASNDLSTIISGHKPGDSITLTVYSAGAAGSSQDIKVTLGENPNKAGAAWLGIEYMYFNINPNANPSPRQGPQG